MVIDFAVLFSNRWGARLMLKKERKRSKELKKKVNMQLENVEDFSQGISNTFPTTHGFLFRIVLSRSKGVSFFSVFFQHFYGVGREREFDRERDKNPFSSVYEPIRVCVSQARKQVPGQSLKTKEKKEKNVLSSSAKVIITACPLY